MCQKCYRKLGARGSLSHRLNVLITEHEPADGECSKNEEKVEALRKILVLGLKDREWNFLVSCATIPALFMQGLRLSVPPL